MPNCPRCGTALDSDDPAGLCSQCLVEGALASSLSEAEARTQTIDTGAAPIAEDDFGRYEILRPLGEGGMGTVYLAEQREPIRRSVALKVIKLGMDTSEVLSRFANERQALFIRLLEGGCLDRADPEKGRFRSFLLASLKFFVADEEDRLRARKRGGGKLVPMELSSGEERYQREPAHGETPERIFERR